MTDLKLSCRCGKVRGVVRDVVPGKANRAICYCKYCAAYARTLGREDLLEDGGTDVFQVSPARVEITEGKEHIACGCLTSTGALRFYASCCQTPIANTMRNAKMPFVGLVHRACIAPPAGDDVIGPVLVRVNRDFPKAEAKVMRATRGALLGMLAHYAPLFIGWRLRGDAKKSPFFDSTGRPIVEPVRLEWDRPA